VKRSNRWWGPCSSHAYREKLRERAKGVQATLQRLHNRHTGAVGSKYTATERASDGCTGVPHVSDHSQHTPMTTTPSGTGQEEM